MIKKVFFFIMALAILTFVSGCFPTGDGDVTLSSIEVNSVTIPEGVEVKDFSISTIKIVLVNSDESTTEIPLVESMLSEEDREKLKTPGTHTISVGYEGFKAEFTITLTEKDESPTTVKVIFIADEQTIGEFDVEVNTAFTDIPEVPTKTGYTGVWDKTDFSNITEAITVNAVYTINKYIVKFVAEGSEDITREVEHGSNLTDIPEVPTKTGYTGVWDKTDFNNITEAITVNAVYTINKYIVKFVAEGSEDITREVEHGSNLTDIPEVPTKTGYTGVWDKTDFNNITEAITVNAVYTINKYIVKFVAEGSEDITREVEHGSNLTDIPEVPTKTGYTGVWDKTDFNNITEAITVNAVYTINKYIVKFVAEGSEDITREVEHGSNLTDIPEVPTKIGYTGVWDKTEFSNITEEITVNAVYTIASNFIYVSSLKAEEGSTITVYVTICGSVNFANYDMTLKYDTNYLTLENVSDVSESSITNTFGTKTLGQVKFNYSDTMNIDTTKQIVKLVFTVNTGVENNSTTIYIDSVDINIINDEYNVIPVEYYKASGIITLEEGEVNE